ncbi:MAG TPA: hypothetical protein VGI05_10395 [Streptosporangiaceae bacterium]|jgi:hypothetical protein
MLAVLLALAAAAGYGGSDYVAGLAARRASVVRVTMLAEATSATLLLCVVPFISSGAPSLTSVLWGAGARGQWRDGAVPGIPACRLQCGQFRERGRYGRVLGAGGTGTWRKAGCALAGWHSVRAAGDRGRVHPRKTACLDGGGTSSLWWATRNEWLGLLDVAGLEVALVL